LSEKLNKINLKQQSSPPQTKPNSTKNIFNIIFLQKPQFSKFFITFKFLTTKIHTNTSPQQPKKQHTHNRQQINTNQLRNTYTQKPKHHP